MIDKFSLLDLRRGAKVMITAKGLLLGLGLAIAGTLIYLGYWMRFVVQQAPPHPGGQVGIDIVSLVRNFAIQSPRYWLMVLVLMALGCAIIYFAHRVMV